MDFLPAPAELFLGVLLIVLFVVGVVEKWLKGEH